MAGEAVEPPRGLELARLCRAYTIDPLRAFAIRYGREPEPEDRAAILRETNLGMAALATRDHDAKSMPPDLRRLASDLNTRHLRWEMALKRRLRAEE